MFDRDPARDEAHEYAPGFALLAERDAAVATILPELRRREAAGELTVPILDFAWSLVHMHCNRLLHASQRAQELVLYDFVRRLHAARQARSRQG
jgi:thiopeptide-type bacteriocin biosynthesis protein